MKASREGHVKCVALLLGSDAKVNHQAKVSAVLFCHVGLFKQYKYKIRYVLTYLTEHFLLNDCTSDRF